MYRVAYDFPWYISVGADAADAANAVSVSVRVFGCNGGGSFGVLNCPVAMKTASNTAVLCLRSIHSSPPSAFNTNGEVADVEVEVDDVLTRHFVL